MTAPGGSRLVRIAVAGRQLCRHHPVVLGSAAAVAFAAAFVPTLTRFRHMHVHTDPWLLVVVFAVFPPLLVIVNAGEFALVARIAGHRVSRSEAVAVSIGGSLANLLPVPGSVMVRSAALTSAGRGIRPTLQAVMTVGGVWVGVTTAALGVSEAWRHAAPGAALATSGALVATACLVLLARQVPGSGHPARRVGAGVVAVEATTVVLDTARLWLVLRAIGAHPTILDALALTAASVLTIAAGVFPAGLGLREALSAGFGAASGLPAAFAVTAAVVDRLVLTAGLGVLALGVSGWVVRRHRGTPGVGHRGTPTPAEPSGPRGPA